MRVLVVGRQGQLALSLNECAGRHGANVIAVGRPDFDILTRDDVDRAIDSVRPEIVINCAAYTNVDKAEHEPEAARAVNALGAGMVAEATARADIPLIHISTDYVFNGTKTSPYVETDATAPLGVYGATKLEGEERVGAANPKHLIFRTAWVISPFGRNFVKTMLALAATRPEISVVDDQVGSPTYAPHLADALLLIAGKIAKPTDQGGTAWGTYHLAGSGETTWCGLAREIFSEAARRNIPSATVKAITTKEYPTPARRPANSRLACDKTFDRFATKLPDWRAGVSDCVARLSTG